MNLIKSILFLFFMLYISSCEDNQQVKNNKAIRKLFENSVLINGYNIVTIEYDSCEYLISGSNYSQMMSHKGNCKYCIKRFRNIKNGN